MITVLLIVHLFVTLALIGVVLIQRSEGGGLGVGTSQGMGSFMSGRGTANLLTRATAVLATIFMLLSLALALLNRGTTGIGHSILDLPPAASGTPTPVSPGAPATGTPAPGQPAPSQPASGQPASPGAGGAPANTVAPATPAPAPRGPNVPTN